MKYKNSEPGQSMVMVAMMLPIIVAVGLYLIVNALFWINTVSATRQAIQRAAQSGASTLGRAESLPMTVITDPDQPDLPSAAARHCLDPERSRTVILKSLEQNLDMIPATFVTSDGGPLTPAQVAADSTGTYIRDLKVVNPPALGCPTTDPDPTYPPGVVYTYRQPYVHLAVYLPVKAIFGAHLQPIKPEYVLDVTSAIDPTGGE